MVARILITDDSADIRHLLSALLVEEGHKVIVAKDGTDALDALDSGLPDLMVLDLMMPRMDGYSVLKEMDLRDCLSQVKVLLLTAKTSESDWVRGFKMGADGYLTKPFVPDELIAAVDEMLTLSKSDLATLRDTELSKAQLLSRLESVLDLT